jgi:hypothetical protein
MTSSSNDHVSVTHFNTYRVEVLSFKPGSEDSVWKLHSIQSSDDALKKIMQSNDCLRAFLCGPKGRKFIGQNF